MKSVVGRPAEDADDPGRVWMQALRRGDENAFRCIVEHYGRRVRTLFQRAGADLDSAEDLTQEVFLRIYRARDHYEPRAKFSTWLHRIVHRIAINEGTRNRWRRAVRFQTQAVGDRAGRGHAELVETSETDPLKQLTSHELHARVRDAVQSLPANQRTALLLNRFEGRSYEEVGEVLGLRLPAVKSLLFRARDNVRKALAPSLGEEVTDGS